MLGKRPLISYHCVQPVKEDISTDAGLLIFRQCNEKYRFTERFSQQLDDSRCDLNHSMLEMVRSHVYGILAGQEDRNEHDALRSDPFFKLLANRLPDDDDLAIQPTLAHFENAITPRSLLRLEDWFIDRFVNSFDEPPREVTLDIDVFDDSTHRQQQLTLYYGYYNQYQYLVIAITCDENGWVVLPALLYGTALGAREDLQCIVEVLREKFPDFLIRVRTDSG